MIKYILTPNGVINRETKMTIKEPLKSPFWEEYIEWKKHGNEPVPMSPGPEYSLVNDEWVLDQVKIDRIVLEKKNAEIKAKTPELLNALLKTLLRKEIVDEADLKENG